MIKKSNENLVDLFFIEKILENYVKLLEEYYFISFMHFKITRERLSRELFR